MLMQVLNYWKANWLPLISGIVIAAIVVPLVKGAAERTHKAAAGVLGRARVMLQEARRYGKRRRAARGHYVGSLSVADLLAVLKDTPVERLHPTYQESMRKAVDVARNFRPSMPTFKLPDL